MVERATTIRDGLVIETVWDENHVGPIELHVTLDPDTRQDGRGIPQESVKYLSLQSLAPDSFRIAGDLCSVGAWLQANHNPKRPSRPDNPELFYSHVALFVALAAQDGTKGTSTVMAAMAAVRPSMSRIWVAAARKRGYLTPNPGGRPSGRSYGTITEKARAILRSQSTIWKEEG